ncbi:glycoside hydrolase family 18 protein, partial [Plenodomus tracheiphilus IPT5]
CVGDCGRKSECNPGWGMQWSTNDKCPLDVCCSEFGFCGTTKEFCGNKEVDRPSCSGSKGVDKVIGYYESWSMTERSCNGLLPEEVPYGIYTHINFAFATINPTTYEVEATNGDAEDLMQRIGALKILQPDLKIWIAIGGWTFTFAKSLLSMMNTYGFDGVDIDWHAEYPVAEDRSGAKADYLNFTSWMENLKASLGDKGLSVTLPSSYWYLQHFDIVHLEKHVDWFNVMLYDLHGAWDLTNKWTGPFINAHTNLTEINGALDLLWRNDISPEKVVYGMAFYGRSFTLNSPSCSQPKCTFASGGNAGECSNTVGVLLNPEIQDIISKNNLKPKLYEKEAVKTINWGTQWVSFDDEETWKIKGDSMKKQCVNNVMVWAVSHDDKNGTNARAMLKGLGKKVADTPKIEAQPATQEPPKAIPLCRWTNCGENCPSGFKNVMRDGTSQTMVDDNKCLGVGSPHQFCCPADVPMPTCTWRGHRNSGICKGGCSEGEVQVGTIETACNFGYQTACCTESGSTYAYGQCKWVGGEAICSKAGGHADCPSDFPTFIVASSNAAGGQPTCDTGARSYCCKDPTTGNVSDPFISPQTIRHPLICPASSQNQYSDFVALLKAYMKDPTCPAASPHLDYFHGEPVLRRSLDSRQECSANNNFLRLAQWMSTLVVNPIIAMNSPAIINAWNTLVANVIDDGLLYLSLLKQRELTNWDPTAMMTDVLLDAQTAGEGMREYQAAAPLVCEIESSRRKRDVSGLELLVRVAASKSGIALAVDHEEWY